MLDIFPWLVINVIVPLAPIGFFYFGVLLIKGRQNFQWLPPIRDGQICFYSTTIAMIAVKDIYDKSPPSKMWFFGLVFCWVVSFFVYSVSVYSTIYPSANETEREGTDWRVAWASIACGIFTTVMVVGLRLAYGVLK